MPLLHKPLALGQSVPEMLEAVFVGDNKPMLFLPLNNCV